jgi:hypothetical protein
MNFELFLERFKKMRDEEIKDKTKSQETISHFLTLLSIIYKSFIYQSISKYF